MASHLFCGYTEVVLGLLPAGRSTQPWGGVRVLQQPWDAAGEGAALRGAHMGVVMVKAGLGVTSP